MVRCVIIMDNGNKEIFGDMLAYGGGCWCGVVCA